MDFNRNNRAITIKSSFIVVSLELSPITVDSLSVADIHKSKSHYHDSFHSGEDYYFHQ